MSGWGHEQPIRCLPVAGPLYSLQRLKDARMPGLTKWVVDVGVWISSHYFTPKTLLLCALSWALTTIFYNVQKATAAAKRPPLVGSA
jgi:hypothetical protein